MSESHFPFEAGEPMTDQHLRPADDSAGASSTSKRPAHFLTARTVADESEHLWILHQEPQSPALQFTSFNSLDDLRTFVCPALAAGSSARHAADLLDDSFSTTTATADGGDEGRPMYWLDVQSSSLQLHSDVLAIFPLHSQAVQMVEARDEDSVDILETYSSPVDASHQHQHQVEGGGGDVVVGIVSFRDWIVTVHDRPSAALAHVMKQVQHFSRKKGGGDSALPHPRLTTGLILSSVISSSVERMLPDHAALLREVDRVEELALIVTDGVKDVGSIIFHLSQKVGKHRQELYTKHRLLRQCTSHRMRATFVAQDHAIFTKYQHSIKKLGHVADRVEVAREGVLSAEEVLLDGISMRIALSNNALNKKLYMMNIIMFLCLPAAFFGNVWGQNISIPFMYQNGWFELTTFYVIVGGCCGYLVLALIFLWFYKPLSSSETPSLPGFFS